MTPYPVTKISQVRARFAGGDVRGALLLAAKFPNLGAQRAAILSAREAYLRPAFQRELGKDPERLISAGLAALQERYGI